jgi:hypothetical protein
MNKANSLRLFAVILYYFHQQRDGQHDHGSSGLLDEYDVAVNFLSVIKGKFLVVDVTHVTDEKQQI